LGFKFYFKKGIGMKVALVTGGSKGIGRATAYALAQKGFRVWVGARNIEQGERTATEFSDEGLNVGFVPLDVSDEASIRTALATIEKETSSLDVLINNAGTGSGEIDWFSGKVIAPSSLPLEMLHDTFAVTFFGAVAVIQIFLPLVRAATAGRIVNVSSGLGSFGLNSDSNSPLAAVNALGYKSSKAALNMATLMFAHELRDTSIKVNSANPGMVATDLGGPGGAETFKGKPGFSTPEEGARIIVQLATLPPDGPNGEFHDFTQGKLPW
jgi:NAD(P)-dependent dehydrogenase (short-subunit alcohol dehydrogenase family)